MKIFLLRQCICVRPTTCLSRSWCACVRVCVCVVVVCWRTRIISHFPGNNFPIRMTRVQKPNEVYTVVCQTCVTHLCVLAENTENSRAYYCEALTRHQHDTRPTFRSISYRLAARHQNRIVFFFLSPHIVNLLQPFLGSTRSPRSRWALSLHRQRCRQGLFDGQLMID